MFVAVGMGGRKNGDGTITVKVQLQDDRPGATTAETREYTAQDLPGIQALIQKDLAAKRDAETDATLNAAVVGKELGRI